MKVLNISCSGLSTIPRSLPSDSLGSLSFLDASLNSFSSVVPEWLFEITSLECLQLSGNSFQGPLPSSIGKMASLSFLAISLLYNATPIPNELGELCNLKWLDLSYSNWRTELNELENTFIAFWTVWSTWTRPAANSLENFEIGLVCSRISNHSVSSETQSMVWCLLLLVSYLLYRSCASQVIY